jgi:hypothetical protein
MDSNGRSGSPRSPSGTSPMGPAMGFSSALREALENNSRNSGADLAKVRLLFCIMEVLLIASKRKMSPHKPPTEEDDQIVIDERHATRIKSGSVQKIVQRVTSEEKYHKGEEIILHYVSSLIYIRECQAASSDVSACRPEGSRPS